jgi:hypothetical protein
LTNLYGSRDPRTAPAVANTATMTRLTNQARRYHGSLGDDDRTGGGSRAGSCRGGGSHNEICSVIWLPLAMSRYGALPNIERSRDGTRYTRRRRRVTLGGHGALFMVCTLTMADGSGPRSAPPGGGRSRSWN